MAHPKHDYDSPEFYSLVEKYASVGLLDRQVAALLELDEDTFSAMKCGNYGAWSEEQNERRSERINRVLTRARCGSNMQAWNTVLRMGVGAIKVKSRSQRGVGIKCECGGKRKNCVVCGGTGWRINDEEVMIQETESEVAPSLQALTTWLYHHDPDFRKRQRGEDTDENVEPIEGGIAIHQWIRREMSARSEDDKHGEGISSTV